MLLLPPLSSAVAILLGYVARREITKSWEAAAEMTLAGIITGFVSGAIGILSFIASR